MAKKKFPTYKELVAKKLADKKAQEERENKQNIVEVAKTAVQFGEQFGYSSADILNAMGMYRLGLKYEGAHEVK
jgi:hypothetical protein